MVKKKKEFCIMPDSYLYETTRTDYNVRHEVFYGTANRKKSIEDGLVIFLPPILHNMSNISIHFDKVFDNTIKQIGQKTYMEYYNKTMEEFIERYGRNYL